MELKESIESINKKLIDEFGRELSGDPRFRVVFSDSQYEKRWTSHTDEGFELLHPEVRLLPKYQQWVRDKYILERLVPVTGETDLTTKISYEPCWVFQDAKGNYLPPIFDACKFIIESLYDQIGKAGLYAKYRDHNVSKEERMIELQKVQDELFGNETDLVDNLHYGSGIVVPGSKEVN